MLDFRSIDSLIIYGLEFEIIKCKRMKDVDPAKEEELWGMMLPSTRKIRIWDGATDKQYYEVLLHEITHAVLDMCPLMENLLKSLDKDENEALAGHISLALVDTLIRNYLIEVY